MFMVNTIQIKTRGAGQATAWQKFMGVLCLAMVFLLMSGCVSTTPDSKYTVNKAKALKAHVELALRYIKDGKREPARDHLRKAFAIDKHSVDATFAMAMLYQLEGEPKLAEQYFKKTLRMKPDYTQARNNYGVYLFEHERYQDAYTQLERASENLDYDNRPEALLNLGRVALKLDKPERAKAAFEHANRLDPNVPALKYELASMYFKEKKYSVAKKYLDAYDKLSSPAPQTLLLGIKIERIFENKDKEASDVLMLKNRFPYSTEYLEYKKMLND